MRPSRSLRFVLPSVVAAAALVAAGLSLAGPPAASPAAPTATARHCPAGYSSYAEFQQAEQRLRLATSSGGVDTALLEVADQFARDKVASGEAVGAGTCVNDARPEQMRELALRAAQQAAPRLAPYASVAPGAFSAAAEQRAALRAGSIAGTAGTGAEYGTGPLVVDDPAHPEVNGLGLGDNSGRVDSFDYDPASGRLFAAVGSGGIWMSEDLAVSWEPLSDTLPSTVTGSVGWAPAAGGRPGTVLALTGEPTFGASAYTGIGAYYTEDFPTAVAAGRQPTWRKATGVPDGALGFALSVSPVDPSVVFAATSLGLFRSADGGRSYVNAVLPVGPATPGGQPCAGVTDLTARPECVLANVVTDVVVQRPGGTTGSPGGRVVAAVGWRGGNRVEPGTDVTQAPSNGVYGSDTGAVGSFEQLNAGNVDRPDAFAEQDGIGRVELGEVSGPQQDHDYLYAIVQDARLINGGVDAIDAPVGGEDTAPLNPRAGGTVLEGVYVSSDFGSSWRRVADDNTVARNPAAGSALIGVGTGLGFEPGVQAWYDLWIKPDPTVQTATGVPTRLLFGLEEVWENEQSPLNSVSGVVGPTSFKVIGRYFAGDSCQLLSAGLPACPTNRAPQVSYTTHPDQQDAIFVPVDAADPSKGVHLVVGNDGGVYRQTLTPDAADDTTNEQQSTVQFGVGTGDFDNAHWGRGANDGFHTLLPYYAAMAKDGTVWAGLQDNGNLKVDAARGLQQFETYGGDGFFSAVDPDDSDVAYEEVTAAAMSVTVDGGTSWRSIPPPITNAKFANPFRMDPTDANHLITAGKEVVETLIGPETVGIGDVMGVEDPTAPPTDWIQVYDLGTAGSPGDPDATPSATDPANGMSAVDVVSDNAYVGFCGICDPLNNALPFKNGLATNVGADVDPERGTSRGWHVAAAKGLPNRYITSVRMDERDADTVYATVGGYTRRWVPPGTLGDENGDIGTGHLYVSRDAGETFTDVSANLPDAPATWVELRGDQVLVGTDLGAFASARTGITAEGFAPLEDVPAVPISSLEVSPADPDVVTIATFGRGVWTYTFDDTVEPVTYTRVQGGDRVATAVETSKQQYRAGADTVVVAVSGQYADALAGAPLAYQLTAPLLLTPGASLAPAAAAEVRRLGAKRAVVLGGPAALAPKVEADLKAAGVTTVERIAGADRFATAAEVAGRLSDKSSVFVVEGADADPRRGWPDAISVGPAVGADRPSRPARHHRGGAAGDQAGADRPRGHDRHDRRRTGGGVRRGGRGDRRAGRDRRRRADRRRRPVRDLGQGRRAGAGEQDRRGARLAGHGPAVRRRPRRRPDRGQRPRRAAAGRPDVAGQQPGDPAVPARERRGPALGALPRRAFCDQRDRGRPGPGGGGGRSAAGAHADRHPGRAVRLRDRRGGLDRRGQLDPAGAGSRLDDQLRGRALHRRGELGAHLTGPDGARQRRLRVVVRAARHRGRLRRLRAAVVLRRRDVDDRRDLPGAQRRLPGVQPAVGRLRRPGRAAAGAVPVQQRRHLQLDADAGALRRGRRLRRGVRRRRAAAAVGTSRGSGQRSARTPYLPPEAPRPPAGATPAVAAGDRLGQRIGEPVCPLGSTATGGTPGQSARGPAARPVRFGTGADGTALAAVEGEGAKCGSRSSARATSGCRWPCVRSTSGTRWSASRSTPSAALGCRPATPTSRTCRATTWQQPSPQAGTPRRRATRRQRGSTWPSSPSRHRCAKVVRTSVTSSQQAAHSRRTCVRVRWSCWSRRPTRARPRTSWGLSWSPAPGCALAATSCSASARSASTPGTRSGGS